MNYYEFDFHVNPKNPWSDIITAKLSELGCDSFVETDNGVKAYCSIANVQIENIQQLPNHIKELNESVEVHFSTNEIKSQNWNAVWEADFEPVFVEDKLAILAPFHSNEYEKKLTIRIQPQMSFGTGHHQTTWMMSKMLLEMSKIPEKTLDMGAGTGVLAILTEKLGGKQIDAIDIEEWAYKNCIENCKHNNCKSINTLLGGVELLGNKKYDLILANINKNILINQIPTYSKILPNKGTLILSGFFETDVADIIEFAKTHKLIYKTHIKKDNWSCVKLTKTND